MAFLASVASSTFSKVTKAKPLDLPVLPSNTTVILEIGPNLPNSFSNSLQSQLSLANKVIIAFLLPLCSVKTESENSEARVGLRSVT